MSVPELLAVLHELNRADKLRVMQFLVLELAKEEDAAFDPEMAYPVWTPYEAFEAAETLLKALAEDKPVKYG